MASERITTSIATDANVLALLKGTLDKVSKSKGWSKFADGIDESGNPCPSTWAVTWSWYGAIGAAGVKLKFLYIPGSYELLDKFDLVINETMAAFGLPGPEDQAKALDILAATIDRLSHS